jgi:hypothetical protein
MKIGFAENQRAVYSKKNIFFTERELPSGVFIKENKIIVKLNERKRCLRT